MYSAFICWQVVYNSDYPKGKDTEQKILSALPKLDGDPSATISFGMKLIKKALAVLKGQGETNHMSLVVVDSMISLFWLLFKKFIVHQKGHMFDLNKLKALVIDLKEILHFSFKEAKWVLYF